MPTVEEIRAKARAAEAAAQQQGLAPLPDEEVRQVIRDAGKSPPQSKGEAIIRAVDDVGRVAGSMLGDPLTAGVRTLTGDAPISGDSYRANLAREQAQTDIARERMGAGAAMTAGIAGDTATLAAAIPNAAVATIPRALATGGALGAADTAFSTWSQTGQLPTMEEELGGAIKGVASSGLGMLAGAGVNFVLNKALKKGVNIDKAVLSQVRKNEKLIERASQRMKEADVVISQQAIQRLVNRAEKVAMRNGVSKTATPRIWQAMNKLRNLSGMGGDVSLIELNQIRRGIRDFDIKGEDYGALKAVTDQINKTINGLPYTAKTSIVRGDPSKGVSAWNALNRDHVWNEKANALVQVFREAEHLTGEKGWHFERALQNRTKALFDDKTGRRLKVFNNDEIDLLDQIARGKAVGNALNSLDAKVGHGAFGLGWGALMSGSGIRPVANAAARNRGQQIVDSILYQSPIRQGMISPLAGIAANNQMDLGGLIGGPVSGPITPQPQAAPPSTPMPTMQPQQQPMPQQGQAAPPTPPMPLQSPQQNPQPLPPSLGQQKRP